MISKFYKFLRKKGMKSRIVFAFIVVPLVLIAVIFLLYYVISANILYDKSEQSAKAFVDMTEENIYLNTTKLEEQLATIMQQSNFSAMLAYPDEDTYKQAFEAYMSENSYLRLRKDFQLFDADAHLIFKEGAHIYPLDTILERKDEQEENSWVYVEELKEIVLIQNVRKNQQLIGYAVCGFPLDALSPSFTRMDREGSMLVIADEQGEYLFGTKHLPSDIKFDFSQKSFSLREDNYYVTSKKVREMDWQIVSLISEENLYQELHNFRNMILLYGILLTIVLEIIAFFIYHSIYDPMNNILTTMRSIDEERSLVQRVVDDGNDEVHQVAVNFNELLDRIEELVKTVESEQEQKRETQFQLLQAQINPHFLFNTLNTLHFLALMNDDKPVGEGISALAKLLRNTITDQKDEVSVAEEIENLKNYIIIQKLRYGDLFETVYNIDEEVKDCKILKFLLQPIVENSILHAFEEDREHQLLTIRAQKYQHYLKIAIGDNGKGFKPKEHKNTNRNLSGIGIDNISERIRLMYGEKYSMQIQSSVGFGTIVTLLLPFTKE
ncbi:cache domain-containing sensor histidine kinase [Amedibacillus dolichus]|uniref:cache domain-containing sensor histidine kinase n=1 Tax=Amedibacillus dolichus TaxID=31971 RepID=UPI0024320942|nr:sensor histidine kinase [Amedibacillus dolichus]